MNMFNRYKIINNGKEDCLYLYIDNPYEFSKEFDKPVETRHQDIFDKIYKYMGAKNIQYSGNKVFLVANGVIVSTLLLKEENERNKYIEYVKDFKNFSVPENQKEPKIKTLSKEKIDHITVHITKNRKSDTYTLEEYIIGALASIMPFYFRSECLKAGSVIIRTNVLNATAKQSRLSDNNFLTRDELRKIWGDEYNKKYEKYKDAVEATKEEYLTYDDYYIDAFYHNTSNGFTESGDKEYLQSVNSKWDLEATDFLKYANMKLSTFNERLETNVQSNSQIRILETTPSNRIKQIEIDGKVFTGKELKEKLNLRSLDFDFIITGGNVLITTRGFGNGLGFSLNGANGMAKQGYSYQHILKHYYPNTELKKVEETDQDNQQKS